MRASPADAPLRGAFFTDAMRRFWSGFFRARGRASRSEYWWALSVAGFFYVLVVWNSLFAFAALVLWVPVMNLTTRRLHDLGRSGWFQLLFCLWLVPVVVAVGFVIAAMPQLDRLMKHRHYGNSGAEVRRAYHDVVGAGGAPIQMAQWLLGAAAVCLVGCFVWWLVTMLKAPAAGANKYGPDGASEA